MDPVPSFDDEITEVKLISGYSPDWEGLIFKTHAGTEYRIGQDETDWPAN